MIRDRSEELGVFHARRFAEPAGERPTGSNGHHAERTDEEVIELARGARNAAKFEALVSGDTGGYPSHSEADQALISLLAFYTQDEEQLDRLYRRSKLCRTKWLDRPDYRDRTIKRALSNLTETYVPDGGARMVLGKGGQSPASPSLSLYKGSGRRDDRPEAVKLADMKLPGPRRYVLKGLVPAPYVTLFYGDGGVAKSLLALALALTVACGFGRWLGLEAEEGPVLYFDAELDVGEQVRRAHQLRRGLGLEALPDGLLYISALGFGIGEVLGAALETCERHGVKLMVLDSLGPALQGDAEASKDVISFYQSFIEPFRASGVAVLVIDHQSKLQAGQSYQGKGAFGSVFKSNLARSVLQVEATERGEGTLTVRVRQKKHNFGPLAEPFGIKLYFSEESVSLEAVELEAAELAEEGTLNAAERVKLALEDGPAYPSEIAESTGLAVKTVKNALTGLRKQEVVKPTGQTEGRTEQIELSVPASLPYKGDGDRDAGQAEDEGYVIKDGEAIF